MTILRTQGPARTALQRQVALLLRTSLFITITASGGALCAAPSTSATSPATFKQFCFQCHGKAAMGGLNLEQLTAKSSIGEEFQHWEKAATALEEKRMPPAKMPQPSDADRSAAVKWIRTKLGDYAARHAGDPGKVTIRRLTSGEYAYTIHDITGLDWKLDGDSGTDSVGGEGFTNYGDVQFMADANLERYLENAKKVADHAVIGAGPLQFFDDPGKSGFEHPRLIGSTRSTALMVSERTRARAESLTVSIGTRRHFSSRGPTNIARRLGNPRRHSKLSRPVKA